MTIPFMSKRIIHPTLKDLEVLLLSSDVDKPPSHDELSDEIRSQFDKLDTGSLALVYEEKRQGYSIRLELVGWKGKNSLRAYVPKNERVHYLRLIGSDVSKYEKNKFEERRAKNNDGQEHDNDQAKEQDSEEKPL